jgi:hypothetical protein
MRFPTTRTALLLAALIVIVAALAQPGAAEPYCPNRPHTEPGQVPADLANKLEGMTLMAA